MNDTYCKLFHSILTSSIWSEDDKTRIMWVTLLAMSDKDGYVCGTIPGAAAMARMSVDDAERAIERLCKEDKYSRTTDHDGRRIEPVEGGWLILNFTKYRDLGTAEVRRTKNAERQARHRERKKLGVTENNASVTQSNAEVTLSHIPYTISPISETPEGGCKGETAGQAFERFWNAYGYKVKKGTARKSFAVALKKTTLEVMLAAIEAQRKTASWKDGFQPHPSTWLNSEGWDNDADDMNRRAVKTVETRSPASTFDGITVYEGTEIEA